MAKHAQLSPSSSHKWIQCPAAPRMERDYGHTGDMSAADEGTAAHFLASEILEGNCIADRTVGRIVAVGAEGARWAGSSDPVVEGEFLQQIDYHMIGRVTCYTEAVTRYAGEDTLFIEVPLPLAPVTGEEAHGTADAIILAEDELQVHDLKYGRTLVRAKGNAQLMVYALAAHEMFKSVHEHSNIRLVIHQPNVDDAPDDYTISIEELLEFGELVKTKAALGLSLLEADGDVVSEHLNAGEHCQTHYCKARARCSALANYIDDICDFGKLPALPQDLKLENNHEELARYWRLTGLVRGWADQIESYIKELVVEKGVKLPGLKMVRGRDGARKWVDEQKTRDLFNQLVLPHDVVFPRTLVSPTQAEKAFKDGKIPKDKWEKISSDEFIHRQQGALTIAPVEDKRPAVQVHHDEDDFDNLENVK